MAGNSAAFAGQAQVFLSAILALFTFVLAYFTMKLYQATDRYANLADSQNAIMKEQNEKVESQNRIMKLQNQLNKENMDHDILVMKYKRMLDEMNHLVAPLYARRYDQQIFDMREFDFKIKYRQFSGDVREDPVVIEFYEFWENIFRYSYLNHSNYLDINKYTQYVTKILKSEEKPQDKLNKFKDKTKKFANIIEYRYIELGAQISEIEKELDISMLSQQASNLSYEYVCIEEET